MPVAKGEAPTLSHDEDSSSSPPPSPPAPAVPPARNKTCTACSVTKFSECMCGDGGASIFTVCSEGT